MPTITLDNGQQVNISQESYDALAKAVEPKELTYNDVANRLFRDNISYYIGASGKIYQIGFTNIAANDPNTSPTENQCKQLLALNMLHNVAYYLNEGWEPDWSNIKEKKYWMARDAEKNTILTINNVSIHHVGGVYFKSRELAERAIKILGEAKIKEAFGIFK